MLQINTLQDKCVIWKTFPMSGIADTRPGRVCQMFSFSSGRGNHLVPRVNSVRSLNEKSSILFQPTLRQIQRKKRWIFDHYSNFPLKLSDVILIEEMLFQQLETGLKHPPPQMGEIPMVCQPKTLTHKFLRSSVSPYYPDLQLSLRSRKKYHFNFFKL